MAHGKVYLVGAGPGDAGLLTLRGKALLQAADAILYDALVNPELLRLAPRAEHVYGGKQAGRHSLPQADINALLLDLAQRHQHVVRLKGGDPFVFGRGGEEALFLAEHGVSFEVVPGVTSGIAVPAYAGIPVTHRGLARSVAFATGHLDAQGQLTLRAEDLPKRGTIVIYMGLHALPNMVELLISTGRSMSTPAAVLSQGTYPAQRAVLATLGTIVHEVAQEDIQPPALLVVGDVVDMAEELGWFGQRPMSGVRVLLTHAERERDELAERLVALGAAVMNLPVLAFAPAGAGELPQVAAGDWLLFTSANAVAFFFEQLQRAGRDMRLLAGARMATVGRSAAQALAARHAHADRHIERHEPELAVAALRDEGAPAGTRVWIPQASLGRRALPHALEQAGFRVMPMPGYATVAREIAEDVAKEVQRFQPHVVVFTNSSAVRHFTESMGASSLPAGCGVASLGPITTIALHEAGLRADIEAPEPTVEALVNAIATRYAPGEGNAAG